MKSRDRRVKHQRTFSLFYMWAGAWKKQSPDQQARAHVLALVTMI